LLLFFILREVRPHRNSRARHRALRLGLKKRPKSVQKHPPRSCQPSALTTVSPTELRALSFLFFCFYFKLERTAHKTTFYLG
jgi:hypothetical protein